MTPEQRIQNATALQQQTQALRARLGSQKITLERYEAAKARQAIPVK